MFLNKKILNSKSLFVGKEQDFVSVDFINYLTHVFNSTGIALGTMVNIKARLSISYSKETGRNFAVDFPEVII
jgi:hypothetical protein